MNLEPVLPMNEFMAHVLSPAAHGVWSRQGYIIRAEGERSLFPQASAEWEEAEESAATLAELSNLLLTPARKLDDGEWAHFVVELRQAAALAMTAAEAQDEEQFSDAGGFIKVACDGCHEIYLPTPGQFIWQD